jgi:phytoene dehydrogenase-like protein
VIATAGHVLDQGDVLWAREAPISTAPIEPLPAEADVVVVGSGYTGVAAARELARRGREVLVLEQGAIGAGASTRNAGFAHAGVRRSLPELRRRFGDALGRELYRDTVAALDHVGAIVDDARIDCHLERRGYLYLAQRPRRARRLRDAQAALAEPLEAFRAHFLEGRRFIGGDSPTIADIRLAATLEFLRAVDYEFPAWTEEYMRDLEETLGDAYSEPAADVRGYVASVKAPA